MTQFDTITWGMPSEVRDLLGALEGILRGVTWTATLGGSAEVVGYALPSAEDVEAGPTTARRALYEVAEDAISAVEALGWLHAKAPEVVIGPEVHRTLLGRSPADAFLQVRFTISGRHAVDRPGEVTDR
ncbi:hypothetical protein GCM10022252_74880 [Streptosporangium oxazolinicum]|uniref:Uncharacterized protein n=1 Tax=Streptosporangium oxazolinicum TaxID=909287 RepID=A0ABP8BKX8_9ACTN